MKYILYLTIVISVVSCNNNLNYSRHSRIATINEKDSLENSKYSYLKGYAICKCIYEVPENSSGRALDISPAIIADIVNFWGIDTLSILATKEAKKIDASKYKDYQNKKATFLHCYEWANAASMDSLLRKYAKASAEEWLKREGGKRK